MVLSKAKNGFNCVSCGTFRGDEAELRVVRTFRKWVAPVSRPKTGASASTESVDVDLVADVYPADAGHPSPAAGSDHHDAAEAAPVAMAPMAVMATHATTLAPAASESFGRDERGGANGGDRGDSKKRLADHGALLGLVGCVLTSCLVRPPNDPSGSTARDL